MPSPEKKEKVKKIKKWFEKTDSLLVLHYKGLKVSEATELRTQVSGLNAELRVLKNTLTRLALADTPKEGLVSLLDGPVAVVFVNEDPVPVARAIRDFARGRSEFYLLGGMIEGRILSGAQVESVAVLPPREVLLAQMVGAIQAPLSGLLGLVTAPLRKTLGLFKALATQAEPAPQDDEPEAQPQAESEQVELNAETKATAVSSEESSAEPPHAPDAAETEAPQEAESEQVELNAETKATAVSSEESSAEPQAESDQAESTADTAADEDSSDDNPEETTNLKR